jgi:hypothetical protein
MSDHDFEKQVQQKMEQLKLRPSDAVWTKVDKRIRKERRRRRVVLWLPLLLLCMVAGGYFYFDTQSNNNNKFTASELTSTHKGSDKNTSESTTTADSSSGNNSGAPVTTPSPATEQTTAPANTTTEQTEVAPDNASPKVDQPVNQAARATGANGASEITPDNKTNVPVIKGTVRHKAKRGPGSKNAGTMNNDKPSAAIAPDRSNIVAAETGNKSPRKTKNNSTEKQNNDQAAANSIAANDTDASGLNKRTDSARVASALPPQLDQVDSATVIVQTPTPAPALNKNDLASQQSTRKKTKSVAPLTPKPARKPSSWSFGIVAEGGASHISKGSPFSLLSKKNNEPEDLAYASPAPSNQNLYGGPAGFTQMPEKKAAPLKSGLSWSAGGFVQKQLSKRISLSAGVQYSYFSTKMQVGEFMKYAISVSNANYDQVVSDFYQGNRSAYNVGGGLNTTSYPRPPQDHEYTNKYHFLEIPVKIHWLVTNEEAALPVMVDGGLSVARLLHSNALHYDGTNDVYYRDSDYFNKIQAGITAGVNVALFNDSKHPVWIGPTIKYQLSNLITSDLSGGQHLWSFGLGAKFFLKK